MLQKIDFAYFEPNHPKVEQILLQSKEKTKLKELWVDRLINRIKSRSLPVRS